MLGASIPELVRVENLKLYFDLPKHKWRSAQQKLRAVDDVSLSINSGEALGLIGESGSGKSTLGRAILQLIRAQQGQVYFDGVELTSLWKKSWHGLGTGIALRPFREQMQIIFQDPYASLDPRMTVEQIVGEPLRNFSKLGRGELRRRVQELLEQVGLDPAYLRRYPHAFSGGQRQRISIARALALKPRFIVCDEPTSALDVSIQAQILNLLKDLQLHYNLSYLFVSHDLAAVRYLCNRVAVMKAGRIVENAPTAEIFSAPQHPYTQSLLAAIPRLAIRS